MSEKRIIDANRLIGWLIKAGRYCKGLENSKPITKAIGIIINYVQGMQTVDAVEVVRCRDCKKFVTVQGRKACTSFFGLSFPEDDGSDFCSHGERRCDNDI